MPSLEAKANKLGIPMQIPIDNHLRYSYCDAHAATLQSIEGTYAVYSGQCACGHEYRMRYEIEELKKMSRIENGEIVVGQGKGYIAEDLGEF